VPDAVVVERIRAPRVEVGPECVDDLNTSFAIADQEFVEPNDVRLVRPCDERSGVDLGDRVADGPAFRKPAMKAAVAVLGSPIG
jgi:hypothetical protein